MFFRGLFGNLRDLFGPGEGRGGKELREGEQDIKKERKRRKKNRLKFLFQIYQSFFQLFPLSLPFFFPFLQLNNSIIQKLIIVL